MNCAMCGTELPRPKRGRRRRFCSTNCRVSLHRLGHLDGDTSRNETAQNQSTKTTGCNGKNHYLPLPVLGPRFPWKGQKVNPLVLERIRFLEVGR